jgi:hypothetical protein
VNDADDPEATFSIATNCPLTRMYSRLEGLATLWQDASPEPPQAVVTNDDAPLGLEKPVELPAATAQ